MSSLRSLLRRTLGYWRWHPQAGVIAAPRSMGDDGQPLIDYDLRRFYGDVQGVILGPQVFTDVTVSSLTNAEAQRQVARALGSKAATKLAGTAAGLRILGLGDSIGAFKMHYMFDPINRAFGGGYYAGAGIDSGKSGPGYSFPGVQALVTTGVITDVTLTDFDCWFTGNTSRFTTGATRTYSVSGIVGFWDMVKIYYVTGPVSSGFDGGTFKVQVDGIDEGAVVNTLAGSIGLGIVTVTRGSPGSHGLGIINLTGQHRIIGVAYFNSAIGGLVYSNVAQASLSLQDATSTAGARANLATYVADFLPDIITLEAKENSSYWAQVLATLLPILTASAPTAAIICIGSTPVSVSNGDQVIQNAQLRSAAAANGCIYWDGYSPVKDYATLVALGWQGDGTHVAEACNQFLAGLLMRDIGILDNPGESVPLRDFEVGTGRVTDQLILGISTTDPAFVPNWKTTIDQIGFDITTVLKREWDIISAALPDDSAWRIRPINTADQQIPHGVRLGALGPYLQSLNSGKIVSVSSARGGGSGLDFAARSIILGINTVNITGAGVLLDLNLGGVIFATLTGNVTSWNFSNLSFGGQGVEVHFIQGAGGPFTLAGANAAIRLAGGALALTAVVGKRDIVCFRTQSGGLWETSRSMNVPA